MEIKDMKNLEVVYNALNNYINNLESSMKHVNSDIVPSLVKEQLEDNLNRAKLLFKEVNSTMSTTLNRRVTELIENKDFTKLSFDTETNGQ